METIGALCFGLVIGWVTYRTLRRSSRAQLSDIASVLGAVGGAAITQLFDDKALFAAYSIGLAVGFFLYFIIAGRMSNDESAAQWMGAD